MLDGRLFLHEHPAGASSWGLKEIMQLGETEGVNTIVVHQCILSRHKIWWQNIITQQGRLRWCQYNDLNRPKLSASVNDLCGKGKRWTLQQDWGGPGAKKARCQLSTAPVESAHQLDIIHANHGDKKNTIIHTNPDEKKTKKKTNFSKKLHVSWPKSSCAVNTSKKR